MKTVNDLTVHGHMAQDYFTEKLGYTEAKFDYIRVGKDGRITFYFELYDDFQRNIPSDMQYKHGWLNTIEGAQLWESLEAWPSREQRELVILSRKAAALDQDLDKITSAQVHAFVEGLRPNLEELRRQLNFDPTVEIK